MDTAETYRDFARHQAAGASPLYQALTAGVAGDPELLYFLDSLPAPKRQPNLLLAAVRYLDGTGDSYPAFRAFVVEHLDEIRTTMLERRTQTNEVGRCATLLPLLAQLPPPLALLEVGASAGLCLLPDRYGYDYDGRRIGPRESPVQLRCHVTGPAPIPAELPEVAWRAGVDLNPLDVHDRDDVRWLEALVWPGQPERVARLRAAVHLAQEEQLRIVRGDLNQELAGVAAQAPADATLVVFHSAVLVYLSPEDRTRFQEQVRRLPGHWVANEDPAVLPEAAGRVGRGQAGRGRPQGERAGFLLALDGDSPIGYTAPHGQWLDWLTPATAAGTAGGSLRRPAEAARGGQSVAEERLRSGRRP